MNVTDLDNASYRISKLIDDARDLKARCAAHGCHKAADDLEIRIRALQAAQNVVLDCRTTNSVTP